MDLITTEPPAVYERRYAPHLDSQEYMAAELMDPMTDRPANVVTSKVGETADPTGMFGGDDLHAPALDIDIPMAVVPSSTPGHCHLFFPSLRLTWPRYHRLLKALTDAGILEPGYLSASAERECTVLRLPGVPKLAPSPDPECTCYTFCEMAYGCVKDDAEGAA